MTQPLEDVTPKPKPAEVEPAAGTTESQDPVIQPSTASPAPKDPPAGDDDETDGVGAESMYYTTADLGAERSDLGESTADLGAESSVAELLEQVASLEDEGRLVEASALMARALGSPVSPPVPQASRR